MLVVASLDALSIHFVASLDIPTRSSQNHVHGRASEMLQIVRSDEFTRAM